MDTIELLVSMRKQREILEQREGVLIATLHEAGVSYQIMADALGLSRQRVRQIGARNGATVRPVKKGQAGESQ